MWRRGHCIAVRALEGRPLPSAPAASAAPSLPRQLRAPAAYFSLRQPRASVAPAAVDVASPRWPQRRGFASSSPEEGTAEAAKKEEAEPKAEAAAEADAGQPDEGSEASSGGEQRPPRVLWKAKPLDAAFGEAENVVNRSAFVSAGGLGLALLGIAPYTAPTPFLFALVLSTLQVRIAHAWQIRQLRAHLRRHVLELTEEFQPGEDEATTVLVRCSGGLSRTLTLGGPAVEGKSRPPLADVLRLGDPFLHLDRGSGSAEDEEALAALWQSSRTIADEELDIKNFEDESDKEANRVVQGLSVLTVQDLEKLEKAGAEKHGTSPKASIRQIARASQMVAGVILVGGGMIGAGGRLAEPGVQQAMVETRPAGAEAER
eukprot:TRINITY_DN18200_c0_g1_i1.p1 TRINITY_DN18200_c0_g1~~TRINITY_DN18200_c0_g1_i1.p1  ORF type:complete len:374 (+),score=94.78 TRINITY_DN18200_c0_g1_i1:77-1198(+)